MWLQANDDDPPSASRAEYHSPHSQIKGRLTNLKGKCYGLFHKEIRQKRMCAEDRCIMFGVLKSCQSCLSLFCVYYIVQNLRARERNWMGKDEIAGLTFTSIISSFIVHIILDSFFGMSLFFWLIHLGVWVWPPIVLYRQTASSL